MASVELRGLTKRYGGVHALFTVTGRPGADGCTLKQPDFATELANRNVIFRIPTPVFGAGLIESIKDSTLAANFASNAVLCCRASPVSKSSGTNSRRRGGNGRSRGSTRTKPNAQGFAPVPMRPRSNSSNSFNGRRISN